MVCSTADLAASATICLISSGFIFHSFCNVPFASLEDSSPLADSLSGANCCLNILYSSASLNALDKLNRVFWLAGTETIDISTSSNCLITNNSVAALYSASITLNPTLNAVTTPSFTKLKISAAAEILAFTHKPVLSTLCCTIRPTGSS